MDRVSVVKNDYGITLANDGSDNATRWEKLQSAVPEGATLFFPKGTYHNSSEFGFVLNKTLHIEGEASGNYDGTTVREAALFTVPITLNNHAGSSVKHVAFDVRNSSVSDGVSSGSNTTVAGNMQVHDILYVGSGMTNPAHAVLIQSGPTNTVSMIRAYNAFHAVAVRSSNTTVSDVTATDSFDVIVKSASGSGSVSGVSLTNINCLGSAGTYDGCMVRVESDDLGTSTANVTIDKVTCTNAAYCFVLHTSNGGVLQGISAKNLTGKHVGTGIYTYVLNSGGAMNGITVADSCFSDVADALVMNPVGADLTLSNVGACTP